MEEDILQNPTNSPATLPHGSWNVVWGLKNPVNHWAAGCIIHPLSRQMPACIPREINNFSPLLLLLLMTRLYCAGWL